MSAPAASARSPSVPLLGGMLAAVFATFVAIAPAHAEPSGRESPHAEIETSAHPSRAGDLRHVLNSGREIEAAPRSRRPSKDEREALHRDLRSAMQDVYGEPPRARGRR
ncbi:hypothetical protein SAMN05216242_1179 [Thauera chlorobenzoica]|nr:hypothetical protein SAMN05216242_1179 [Thauera chlorobenzoica]